MTKKNRKRARHLPPKGSAPIVHVKVALADVDLAAATRLVKPALLYADRVTIYSPAAAMLKAVVGFAEIDDLAQRIEAILAVQNGIPDLEAKLGVDAGTLRQVAPLLKNPSLLRIAARASGADMDELNRTLDELNTAWETGFGDALEEIKDTMGAREMLLAIDAKAVKVADIGTRSPVDVVRSSVLAASGNDSDEHDDLAKAFAARVVELMSEDRTFPLLDAQSSGLIRAFEEAFGLDATPASVQRGREISAAATFMGFLPHFPELPMDEVLDIRRSLASPLARFRGAIARLSREFSSRAIDVSFAAEVADAWRREVAPALADIREALAEHGFLTEVRSIALGDPRRLLLEAGGVLAATHGEFLSVSGLVAAALTAGLPLADLTGRATLASLNGRRDAKKHAFYFLHRVAETSALRATR